MFNHFHENPKLYYSYFTPKINPAPIMKKVGGWGGAGSIKKYN